MRYAPAVGARRTPLQKPLAAFLVLLLGIDVSFDANCTTLTVSNCDDSGPGSLRAAIHAAASGDTVDLTSLVCSTISLTSGELVVLSPDITIEGNHYGSQARIRIDAGGNSRVFTSQATPPSIMRISRLILENGYVYNAFGTAAGGCVYSNSAVSLLQSYAYHCSAQSYSGSARGGAIYAASVDVGFSRLTGNDVGCYSGGQANGGAVAAKSAMSIEHSTIAGNSSHCRSGGSASGGGIWLQSGTGFLSKSTVTGNDSSQDAGAIDTHVPDDGSSNFSVLESTISGNSAGAFVGGMRSAGMTFVFDSTIVFNRAASFVQMSGDYNAAGLHVDGTSVLELSSTIIANNIVTTTGAGADFSTAKQRPLPTLGHDLVQVPLSPVPSDTIAGVCPLLGPLVDNGGWTQTHRLHSGSRAIDHGFADVSESTDQRDLPKPSGAAPDIGAYEVQKDDELFDAGFDGC